MLPLGKSIDRLDVPALTGVNDVQTTANKLKQSLNEDCSTNQMHILSLIGGGYWKACWFSFRSQEHILMDLQTFTLGGPSSKNPTNHTEKRIYNREHKKINKFQQVSQTQGLTRNSWGSSCLGRWDQNNPSPPGHWDMSQRQLSKHCQLQQRIRSTGAPGRSGS